MLRLSSYRRRSMRKRPRIGRYGRSRRFRISRRRQYRAAPIGVGVVANAGAPSFRGQRTMTVSHREYIGGVSAFDTTGNFCLCPFGSSVATANAIPLRTYALNPANSNLFPWLAGIASAFDKYKFRSVKVIYEPVCSTATAGTVCIACDPDPLDAMPITWAQITSLSASKHASVWSPMVFRVPSSYFRKSLFISAPYDSSVPDRRLTDSGSLAVAIEQYGTTGGYGKLYIEYTVRLIDPEVSSSSAGSTGNALVSRAGGNGCSVYATSATGYTSGADILAPAFLRHYLTTTTTIKGDVPLVEQVNAAGIGTGICQFCQPWQGIMSFAAQGTTFNINLALGGTIATAGHSQICNVFNGSATDYFVTYLLNASVGDTITLGGLTWASFAGAGMMINFAPASYSSLQAATHV